MIITVWCATKRIGRKISREEEGNGKRPKNSKNSNIKPLPGGGVTKKDRKIAPLSLYLLYLNQV